MKQKLFVLLLLGFFFADSLKAQMPRPQRPERPQRQKDSAVERERPVMPPFEGGKFRNTLRIYPLTTFDAFVGGGFSYERQLDTKGNVGLIIPISYGVGANSTPFGHNHYFLNGAPNNAWAFFINPGIKFYPGGQRRVNYALGVSLFWANGTTYADAINNPSINFLEKVSFTKVGLLINNYIQFNVSNRINFGMEIGLGPSYLNRLTYDNPELIIKKGINFFGQAAFHLGYRF